MIFLAQIKKVVARKTVSNDREIEVTLITEQTEPLALGAYPTDELVKVEIRGEKET
jgi:hypothetical protein